jgi:hypothetical protein
VGSKPQFSEIAKELKRAYPDEYYLPLSAAELADSEGWFDDDPLEDED